MAISLVKESGGRRSGLYRELCAVGCADLKVNEGCDNYDSTCLASQQCKYLSKLQKSSSLAVLHWSGPN